MRNRGHVDLFHINTNLDIDEEIYELLDWWLGEDWTDYDVTSILREIGEEDEDGWHLTDAARSMNDNDMHALLKSQHIDYRHNIMTNLMGQTIYDGTDENELLDTFNALAAKRGWTPEGDVVMAIDYDEMVEMVERQQVPLMVVTINHKGDLTTTCEIAGMR